MKLANTLEAYQNSLLTWLEDRVIEEVQTGNVINSGYFLPHLAMFKNLARIKIRAVFDASAHLKNSLPLDNYVTKIQIYYNSFQQF